MSKLISRAFSVLLGGVIAYVLGALLQLNYLAQLTHWGNEAPNVKGIDTTGEIVQVGYDKFLVFLTKWAVIALGFVIGYLLWPVFFKLIMMTNRFFLDLLRRNPRQRIIAGIVGMIAGVFIGFIITVPLFSLFNTGKVPILSDHFFQFLIYLLFTIVLGYLGTYIAANVFFPEGEFSEIANKFGINGVPAKVLDTSVIIDGRIAEIVKSKFLEGVIVITTSVLRELQSIADSPDSIKRGKGRRGLEILRGLQENPNVPVQIYDDNHLDPDIHLVDERIIRVARELHGSVVTNDFNLNRVAMIQSVKVLNINELSNALKPMVVPGEAFNVNIIKQGKEQNQGVAYLDDGTMVVVENGDKHIGSAARVRVTSVMQTVAGRLIFAKLDEDQD